MRARARFAAGGFVLVLAAAPAGADFVPEIPGTGEIAPNARSLGLAGSGVASSESSGSIVLNPAALALVRRGEMALSFHYQKHETTSGLHGTRRAARLTTGDLASLGVIYPVPASRGALALAFLLHRQSIFDRDLVRSGVAPDGGRENETLEERGDILAWNVGASVQVSPSAFVGFRAALLTGDLVRRSRFTYEADGDPYSFDGRDASDLSGVRGSLGALYFPHRSVRVGLRFNLPYSVSFEGTQHVAGASTSFRIDDEVTYPFAAGAGAAFRHGRVLATAEVEFVPWTLLELNGERLRTEERVEGYRDVAILRIGAELALAPPIRVRAGYRFDPSPYRLLLAEVRDQNPVDAFMEEASMARERYAVSGGVGVLVENALDVDAAVEWIHAEKTGANVAEASDLVRAQLTTAFRF